MGKSVLKQDDFFKITESSIFILGALWEQIYLIDKTNGIEILLGDFDGITETGIISPKNDWVITANDKILIWKNNETIKIDIDYLKNIEYLKLLNDTLVELHVDSLNLNGNKAIWNLNIETLELIKIE